MSNKRPNFQLFVFQKLSRVGIYYYALTLFVLLAILIFFPISKFHDNAEATPTLSATTLTLSTANISTEIAPTNANGTFAESDPSTISIITNNYTGYTLGITPSNSTDSTKLINTTDNTKYLTSISSASTESEFTVNTWGYLPSKLNSQTNTTYQPAPTTTTTLETTSAANSTANTYTIKLATKADYTLPEGNYTNSYIVTAVANPATYSITYNKNTTDTVTNIPEAQAGNTENTSITLSNLTPSRAHYDFLGWCTTTPTTSGNTDSCSGTTYQPGATIDLNQTTVNTIILKAMWFKMYTCSAQYKLQNADGTYPSAYTSAGVVAQDLHNGDTCSYTSTQSTTYYTNQTGSATVNNANATISLSIPRKTYKLTFANSTYGKVSTGTTGNYRWGQSISIVGTYNTGGDFTSWSATAGSFANANSASTTYTMPASAATVTANGSALYLQNLASSKCTTTARYAYDNRDSEIYQIRKLADNKCWIIENLRLGGGSSTKTITSSNSNTNKNFTIPASSAQSYFNPDSSTAYTSALVNSDGKNTTSTIGGSTVKYGNNYNLCAASAGTYCYSYQNSSGNVSYDICPKAWRMPTGSESSALFSAYSSNITSYQNAFKMPYSGCLTSANTFPRGSHGCMWTSTRNNNVADSFLSLDVSSSVVLPTDDARRFWGFSVRCVLK